MVLRLQDQQSTLAIANSPRGLQGDSLLTSQGQQDVVAGSLSFGVKQPDLGVLLLALNHHRIWANKLCKLQNPQAGQGGEAVGDGAHNESGYTVLVMFKAFFVKVST